MKTKSMLAPFLSRLLLAGTCVIAVLSSFTVCNAQSIVGKWQGVSVKNYFSAEGAKIAGRMIEEKTAKEAGNSTIEYKPDHTFSMKFSAPNSSNITVMKGIWALTGNQLKLTLEPQYNPKKNTTTATISISGNTLVTTAIISPPSRVIKTISTSTKM